MSTTTGKTSSQRKQIVIKANEIDSETQLSNCFHKVTAKLYVSLAPMFFSNPIEGLKQQHLDSVLMTYSQEARGVILSYSDIKVQRRDLSEDGAFLLGNVKYDTAFAFLWISVTYLVWRPLVGDVVEGYCYMQTPSHIGLLIHDTFNANIKKYYIPYGWEFLPNADDETEDDGVVKSLGFWQDENGVKVDGVLRFTIRAVHTSGKFVSVEGTLLSEGEDNQEYEYNEPPSNTHKKFLDDEGDTTLTVIPEPAKEELEEMPRYTNDSDEERVLAEADSSEEEDDDD